MAYFFVGHTDNTAGSEITAVCPPNSSMVPVLRGLQYRTAGTAHNLYVMRARGLTTVDGGVAAGGTTINVAKVDPSKTSASEDEALATSDWVVYQTRYGSLEAREVSGVSGNALTVAATGEPIDDGAKLWAFYEPAAANYGAVHLELAAINTTHTFENLFIPGGIPSQDGVEVSVSGAGSPMLIVSDNVTAAGDLDWASFEWHPSSDEFLK